jgi:hypothetical protein
MCPPPPSVILDLEAHNLSQWNVHLRAILGHHGLLSHIEDSLVVAPTNPIWVLNDFVVVTAMHSLISRDALDMIQTDGEDDMRA